MENNVFYNSDGVVLRSDDMVYCEYKLSAYTNLIDYSTSGWTFYGVDASDDGKYILVGVHANGGAFLSTDYGSTFNRKYITVANLLKWITMSSDGKYQLALPQTDSVDISISNNYGTSFTDKGVQFYLVSCAISDNGGIISIVDNYNSSRRIWLSSNSGNSFSAVGPTTGVHWRNIAISNNGTHQIAVSNYTTSKYVYISNDTGVTWSLNLTGDTFNNCDVSSDGKYMTVASGGGVYISNNYGSTWTKTSALSSNLCSIAGTGQYQVMTSGEIYYSTDYGVNWGIINGTNEAWQDIKLTTNLKYIFITKQYVVKQIVNFPF